MSEQLFFKSGADGRVYGLVNRDEISLRDVITFPRDAEEVLGHAFSWAEFEDLSREIDDMTREEQERHPLIGFVMAVSVWTSRRAAGDTITFGQCLDEKFEWVTPKQPTDRQPGKAKGSKKAPAKKKSTRTSAPASDRPATTAPTE